MNIPYNDYTNKRRILVSRATTTLSGVVQQLEEEGLSAAEIQWVMMHVAREIAYFIATDNWDLSELDKVVVRDLENVTPIGKPKNGKKK